MISINFSFLCFYVYIYIYNAIFQTEPLYMYIHSWFPIKIAEYISVYEKGILLQVGREGGLLEGT